MSVKEAVDKIFEQKVKEHNLKSGDITPLQQHSLEKYCNKIEEIIADWIEQNKGGG